MARYIDAEIAIEKCNKLIDNADSCPNPYAIEGVRVVRNIILSDCETGVPTADVVEVKHAYWKETTHATISKRGREIHSKLYNCSYCDAPNGRKKSRFCRWCGANMDGGETE